MNASSAHHRHGKNQKNKQSLQNICFKSSAEHHASKSALCQFYTRFKVYPEDARHQRQSPLEVLLVDVCWDDNLDVASL